MSVVYLYLPEKCRKKTLNIDPFSFANIESFLLPDLDDVERLIHKFDVFFDNLTQQKDKLNDFNALSSELEQIVQDFEIGARNKEVST